MKTIDLEEIKNIVAINNSYDCWDSLPPFTKIECVNEVAELYAEQSCDLQIEACAERASSNCFASINNTPNVVK